ncbi:MAG: lysophospholipase, partial [Candidatus Methylomirabilis sp.]|nr:lysophospholipase [Deltaproteobacteria bacterium]
MVKLSYVNSAATGAPVLATELHRAPGSARRLAIYAHGLASTRGGDKPRFFRDRLPALGWDFAAFDFQGHGESSGDLRRPTLSRQIEDLAAVVEAHGPLYER